MMAVLFRSVLVFMLAAGSAAAQPPGDAPAGPATEEPPPYFDGPVWQDLKLIRPFVLAIVFVQLWDRLRARHDEDAAGGSSLGKQKFQMYPYAM
mmetsp:Transcript_107377/g.303594  ORF Transcript_107377/g.303594 Transcript_107377/m.303594 type:complete len:94 (-) Transcript_107377:208-489(-)